MPNPASEWHHFLTYFPLGKANWPFKAYQQLTPPLLFYYSGTLAATPSLRHLFLVSQLKGTDTVSLGNQSMPRPRMFDHKTSHDFTMVYAQDKDERKRNLLFHFQISGSDITAKQLSYFLVEVLSKARASYATYLGDRQHRNFWEDLAATKLAQLNVDDRIWMDDQPLF